MLSFFLEALEIYELITEISTSSEYERETITDKDLVHKATPRMAYSVSSRSWMYHLEKQNTSRVLASNEAKLNSSAE